MKYPDFSEFTFGYALTDNLVHHTLSGVRGLPIFPSLADEGQSGVGYDVKIPRRSRPMFLQFKLPQVVKRHRSSAWTHNLTPLYYRMHLMRSSDSSQHRSLLRLARKGKDVFYVAPEFHSRKILATHHSQGQVPLYSAFFDPRDIGSLSDEPHHVAYKAGNANFWVCSEPREGKRHYIGEHFVKWINENARQAEEIKSADKFFAELLDSIVNSWVEGQFSERVFKAFDGTTHEPGMVEDFPDRERFFRQRDRIQDDLAFQSKRLGNRLVAGYAARLLLDCELLVLGHGELI